MTYEEKKALQRYRAQQAALEKLAQSSDPSIAARAKAFLDAWPIPRDGETWRELVAFRRSCHQKARDNAWKHRSVQLAKDKATRKVKVYVEGGGITTIESNWTPPEWLSNPDLLPKKPPGQSR